MPFVLADQKAKLRLIMSLSGRVKRGKTHFALTAPGPLAVQSLDMGLDGVVQKFQDEKIINVATYPGVTAKELKTLNDDEVIKRYVEVWEQFRADYEWALANARSIVWDTGTEAWELLRLARLGRLGQVKPHHYTLPNMEFRELIRLAESSSANLILLHRMKKEYVNNEATGKWDRAGFSDVGSWVHLLARAERHDDGFHIEVEDCRQNPELRGLDLPQHMAHFAALAQLVFPDSRPEDWL
jgi:hypothetical protein